MFVASCYEEDGQYQTNVRLQLWGFFIVQFGHFAVMMFIMWMIYTALNLGDKSLC